MIRSNRRIDEIETVAERAGPNKFINFQDTMVGRVLVEHSQYWHTFTRDLGDNPALHYIWSQSTHNSRSFFEQQLSIELGIRLKASAWWKKNLVAMELNKRNLKTVRKVMES